MSFEDGDESTRSEQVSPATPVEDDSGLAPAASVRAPAKPAQESGVTTLLVLIALLALVVAVGLRLIAE